MYPALFKNLILPLYEKIKGLSKESFASNHPGGLLGKTLRLKVANLMIAAKDCATVGEEANLEEVILRMTKFNVGLCAVTNKGGELLGVIAEGDIRRSFTGPEKAQGLNQSAGSVMTKTPVTVSPESMAYEALKLMEKRSSQISVIPVVDGKQFAGVIRLHDLVKEGFSLDQ